MAEVHLFGDYLNLHGHSIAAGGERRSREGRGGQGMAREERRGGKERIKKGRRDNRRQADKKRSRGEEIHHRLG